MWCAVLTGLKNIEDLINVSNCSRYFRTILLKNRVYFNFPNIVNALITIEFESVVDREQNINVVPCITKKDLLNCRLVCSNWNTAIEKWYDQPIMSGLFPFIDDVKERQYRVHNSYERANPYTFMCVPPFQAQQFINEFIEKPIGVVKNPFLGRFVVFKLNFTYKAIFKSEATADISNEITRILESFGHEIWHVVIVIEDEFNLSPSKAIEYYMKLRSWLSAMPNIKSLGLKFRHRHDVDPKVMQKYPLPQLTELIQVKLWNVHPNVMNVVLEKYSQISYVQLWELKSLQNLSANVVLNLFTHLKGLYLLGYQQDTSESQNTTGIYNRNGQKMVWSHQHSGITSYSQLEIIKNYYSKSIQDLALTFCLYQEADSYNSKNLQLNAPELKRLRLFTCENLCIDFIHTLVNLEILHIWIEHGYASKNNKFKATSEHKIKFCGFEDRMQQSNIWDVLSKLRVLEVRTQQENFDLSNMYTRKSSSDRIRKRVYHLRRLSKQNAAYFEVPWFQ